MSNSGRLRADTIKAPNASERSPTVIVEFQYDGVWREYTRFYTRKEAHAFMNTNDPAGMYYRIK